MKRIELTGTTFTYGGRLLKTDWAQASQVIEAAGGIITKNISQKLDCFVAGLRCGSKRTQALSRGAVVIDEEQLGALLEYPCFANATLALTPALFG